ncbi:MAG: hypothetical protein AB7U52_05105 [Candidatus Izemoplasmatales bacterium]
MKKIEIEARIRKAAIEEMPDIISRINLDNIVIEPRNRKTFNFNFPRFIKLAVTSIALVITAFFVYNSFFSSAINSNTPLESDVELLGFQTVTGAILLEDSDVAELSFTDFPEVTALSTTITSETININSYIEEINPFMHMMETILNTDNTISYETFTSDDELYTNAFSYTSSDLAKKELTFKIYYNQSESQLNGVIKFSDKVYNFESNNSQTKVESDESNYIVVTDSSTDLQQKFNYKLYQNGLSVMENNLEIYRVQKNIQVKTMISKNGLIMNLYVQRKFFDNLDEFEVDYEIENEGQYINGQFQVNLEFDQEVNDYNYRYVLANNGSVDQPRGPFGGMGRNN